MINKIKTDLKENRKYIEHYRRIISKANPSGIFMYLSSDFLKLLFIKYLELNKDVIKEFIKIEEGFSWKNISETQHDIGVFIDKVFENIIKNNPKLSALSFLEEFSDQRHRRVPFDKKISKKGKEKVLKELINQLNKVSEYNSRPTFNRFARAIVNRYQYSLNRYRYFGKSRISADVMNYIEGYLAKNTKRKETLYMYDPCFKRGEIYLGLLPIVCNGKKHIELYCNDVYGDSAGVLLMKTIINGIYNFEIKAKKEAWFLDDFLIEKDKIKKFDIIIANSIEEYENIEDDYIERIKNNFNNELKNYTDKKNIFYNFLLESLNETGNLVMITNYNFLTSSGSRRETRKYIVENNILEEVISVYGFIYSAAGFDPAILLIDKKRKENKKNNITFVDLERAVKKLSRGDSSSIQNVFHNSIDNLKDIEYALCEKQKEDIEKNDFNLNVFKYLAPIPQDSGEALEEIVKRLNGTVEEFQKQVSSFSRKIEKFK